MPALAPVIATTLPSSDPTAFLRVLPCLRLPPDHDGPAIAGRVAGSAGSVCRALADCCEVRPITGAVAGFVIAGEHAEISQTARSFDHRRRLANGVSDATRDRVAGRCGTVASFYRTRRRRVAGVPVRRRRARSTDSSQEYRGGRQRGDTIRAHVAPTPELPGLFAGAVHDPAHQRIAVMARSGRRRNGARYAGRFENGKTSGWR